jgi:hypothetical protein
LSCAHRCWFPKSTAIALGLVGVPEGDREALDALVLLSMVARVSRRGWEFVLSEHCGVDMTSGRKNTEDREFDPMRLAVVVKTGAKLTSLFSGLDAPPSVQFAMAAWHIASYDNPSQSQPCSIEISVVMPAHFR